MTEPERIEAVVTRVEGILARRRAGTETLRAAWDDGRLTKQALPCYDRCDGHIMAMVEGEKVQGFCPVYMEENVCPLTMLAAREMTARLQRAGFGVKYHEVDVTRLRANEAVQGYLARSRANVRNGRGLILAGDVGVGKTMTLAYIARQLIEDGHGVWKVHMPEFISLLSDLTTRRATVERAIKVEMLMIDDFGSGDMPEWVLGILEGIVEHRYGNQRPMIITTNLDRQVLIRVPEFRRMVDRWRETCQFVGIGGVSQRHDPEQG